MKICCIAMSQNPMGKLCFFMAFVVIYCGSETAISETDVS